MKQKQKGFTLVELLVVISIIGVLASIVLPALGSARDKAMNKRLLLELRQFRIGLEIYYIDHGYYPNRENGQTHQNSDLKYRYFVGQPNNDTVYWSELTTKMEPYYDMELLVKAFDKLGRTMNVITYYPILVCGGNSYGPLAQSYTLQFNINRTQERIDEYYAYTSGWYSIHCMRHRV